MPSLKPVRVLAAALLATATSLAIATPVHAAEITVNTTDDEIVANATTSLREAVTAANAAAEPTTINLEASALYQLDLCDLDDDDQEDTNASGDLDLTTTQPLTINGNDATIEQTCAGERILQALHASSAVTINLVTLTGGEGQGAAVSYGNDLTLFGVDVNGNDAGGNAVLDSEAAMSGPTLVLNESVVGPNIGTGIRLSQGTATITNSHLSDNSLRGVGLIDGALTVSGSTFADNGTDGVVTTGQGSGLFTFTNSIASGNGGTGVICSACGDLQVVDSAVFSNDNGGIQVGVDQDAAGDNVTITLERTSVFDNEKAGPGGALAITITELVPPVPPAQILISRSGLTGNTVTGATGLGGAVYAATGEVRVNNSTIVGNSASVAGGAVATITGEVHLQHATIVENGAPAGANIESGAGLHSFGSIVADAAGAGQDCNLVGATVSSGYNIGGDASCAFAGVGDSNNVANPGLGVLQNNGGATLTKLPVAGSPALGKVPAAACTVFAIDQRGTARPQGANCEAGAAEVALDGGGGLATTGTPVTGLVLGGLALLGLGVVLALVFRRRSRPSLAS